MLKMSAFAFLYQKYPIVHSYASRQPNEQLAYTSARDSCFLLSSITHQMVRSVCCRVTSRCCLRKGGKPLWTRFVLWSALWGPERDLKINDGYWRCGICSRKCMCAVFFIWISFKEMSLFFESAYTLTISLPNDTMLQVGGEAGRASWSINQIHVVAEGCQRLFHWETFHLWYKGRLLTGFWKC